MAEKSAKTGPPGPLLLPKLVLQTTFAAKIGLAGPILAAKNGPLLPKSVPHGGLILAKNYLPKLVPLKVALLFLRIDGYMDATIISSYACMAI